MNKLVGGGVGVPGCGPRGGGLIRDHLKHQAPVGEEGTLKGCEPGTPGRSSLDVDLRIAS